MEELWERRHYAQRWSPEIEARVKDRIVLLSERLDSESDLADTEDGITSPMLPMGGPIPRGD